MLFYHFTLLIRCTTYVIVQDEGIKCVALAIPMEPEGNEIVVGKLSLEVPKKCKTGS